YSVLLTSTTPTPPPRVVTDALVPLPLLRSSDPTTADAPPLAELRPPTAYSVPLMAATPSPSRGVAIDAFVVHVLLPGSYASTVAKELPPTAYSVPLMAATPSSSRGVAIDALAVQIPAAGAAAAGLNTQAAAFVDA